MAVKAANKDLAAQKAWIGAVDSLCKDIEKWAASAGWPVERQEKSITEDAYGTYAIAELFVATPQGRIIVNPIGLDIRKTDGRVDIEAFPSFVRFVLLRHGSEWELRTDNMIRWPEPWGKSTFLSLALQLSAA